MPFSCLGILMTEPKFTTIDLIALSILNNALELRESTYFGHH